MTPKMKSAFKKLGYAMPSLMIAVGFVTFASFVFLGNVDDLVISQNWDGKVKSSICKVRKN